MNRFLFLPIAFLTAIAVATVTAPAAAQRADTVATVVAVVGDSIILNHDIDKALLALAETGTEIPVAGPERERLVQTEMDRLITDLLVVQAAIRDTTIKVDEAQIRRTVEDTIAARQRLLGGVVPLEAALRSAGLTLSNWRELLVQQMKQSMLMDSYRRTAFRGRQPPPVTEAEIRAAFEAFRESFPMRPASVSFHEIVVPVKPTDSALAHARQRADSIYDAIVAGEDFEVMARRFGQDGTREAGGALNWFRRGEFARDFENVAFQMRAGQMSPPILTQFGWHIIKVERVRGTEVNARHILIRPELTPADEARARAIADTVAAQLRVGADPDELRRQFGDQDQPLRIPPQSTEVVAQEYGISADLLVQDTILDPIARPAPGGSTTGSFAVIQVLEREEARPWMVTDPVIRENLRTRLEQQKMNDELVGELRRSSHVEIRRAR